MRPTAGRQLLFVGPGATAKGTKPREQKPRHQTGFVIGVLFLELHGFVFKASEADVTQAVMALAAGTLEEAAYVV